jgi:hypothetical protein
MEIHELSFFYTCRLVYATINISADSLTLVVCMYMCAFNPSLASSLVVPGPPKCRGDNVLKKLIKEIFSVHNYKPQKR